MHNSLSNSSNRTRLDFGKSEGNVRNKFCFETIRNINLRTIEQFFTLLEKKDIRAWMNLWDNNCIQTMPFSPKGYPKKREGKKSIYERFRNVPQIFISIKFPDRHIQPMLDPERFIVEYRGELKIAATGKSYNNRYLSLFRVKSGKIIEFVEYFDPIVLLEAFENSK